MTLFNNTYALLSGYSWSTPVIGYYFPDSLDGYRYKYSFMDGFAPVGAGIQQAVRNILEGPTSAPQSGDYMTLTSASAVANLVFYSTGSSRSDIAVGRSSELERPTAYYPKLAPSDGHAGDVWLHDGVTSGGVGTYSYHTLLHELGHALGLKHGHEQANTNNPFVLTPDRDSIEFSVMTYREYVGDETPEGTKAAIFPQTLMMYDIAALQHLYGANFDTNSTDTVYKWTPERETFVNGVQVGHAYNIFMTVWDGGGIDTYDFSSFDQGMTIDLNPGAWSIVSTRQLAPLGDDKFAQGNIFNALQYKDDPRSLIENVIASFANDRIIGNAADNRLDGDYGKDSLSGASGNDTLIGGEGNDWLDGGTGADLMDGGADWDVVSYKTASSGATVDLTTNVNAGAAAGDRIMNVEVLQGSNHNDMLIGIDRGNGNGVQLYGEGGDDGLIGKAGGDYLFGGAGNDWLDGGAGGDVMDGQAGWDVVSYQSATSGVAVDLSTNLNGGAAHGDVISNVEVVQGSNFDDSLTGIDNGGGNGVQLYGEGGHDTLIGKGGGDYLVGGAGNDTLDSGFGDDVLNGGAGADAFRFSTGLGAGNVDTIQDFSAAEGDRIVLSRSVFMDVGTGALSSAYFSLGAATSFDHHILYVQATGELFYDVDGSGGVAAIKFATVSAGTVLSASDFFVA
ncbi:M10 family metallopeptidase C-terminal domain-containing protein [Microvirga sp. HBU67558]|uniref:M10 family metallopeptidase n=2 Tax=Methylobacteriaceae TaxID=119045 RepID=UPI001B36A516|nr:MULTISPECIES: M10 family metallopeptidase [unclassified Microvirga]MBQ0820764.1 M10 family metallopeptidase C-terminal domain-containing protein [Microvirga sp. HBU67558]